MASKPYFDHKTLGKMIAKSKKVAPLSAFEGNFLNKPAQLDMRTVGPLEPLTIAKVPKGSQTGAIGHMMTPDGRLALRVILQSEAERFGVDGLTHGEGAMLLLRIEQMADLENIVLQMQRDVVKLSQQLSRMVAYAQSGEVPPAKEIVASAVLLKGISND